MYADTEIDAVKRCIHLADLVPGLKRDSQVHWKGPCPFCGEGDDRFEIKATDDGDLWHCRHCAPGPYSDAIDFLERRDGITFGQVLERYGDGAAHSGHVGAQTPPRPSRPLELERPPDEDWQEVALEAAAHAAAFLHGDSTAAAAALAWLTGTRKRTAEYYGDRCLSPETVRAAGLGYNPRKRTLRNGRQLPRGITVPGMVDGALWYVKVRMSPGEVRKIVAAGDKANKFLQIAGGNGTALYGADRLLDATAAIVVEGEFDALLLGQYCPPEFAVVTMGGAGNLPGVTWLRYFAGVDDVILVLDEDDAGRAALARWQAILPRARAVALPWGRAGQPARGETDKDATDFRRAGGNPAAWVAEVLR